MSPHLMSLNMSVEVLVVPKLTKAMRVSSPLENESHVCCQIVFMHSICLSATLIPEVNLELSLLTRVMIKGEGEGEVRCEV